MIPRGGGLAIYVATSKYQTMEKVSVAQSRLEVVRAVGDIPRYMNTERGFATNILYGPAAIDPAVRKELNEKVRKNTDGARDKMNAVRKNLPSSLDDATVIGAGIDRKARVTCQNSCRLMASATECAVPGRMMNWRSPFGRRL